MTIRLPEINFLTTNPEELSSDLVQFYEELEGRKLAEADPLRIIFLAVTSFIAKQNIRINDAARQNLLYYARGDVLKHKGQEWNTPVLEATPATTTLRLHLSTRLTSPKIVNKGTLATSNEAAIFFASKKDAVITTQDDYVDIEMVCTVTGPEGNGFLIGEINTLVNPLPYISRVENITISAGGALEENEDSHRERIYLAPERLSTAGPSGAYEFFARSASQLISDVYVDSPQEGRVAISVLLENGQLPTQEILDSVYEIVNDRRVRPLTDFVTVSAPGTVSYDLDVTYYLESEAVDKSIIRAEIEKAIENYIIWQSSKIGRDINPTKLISECYRAGAKRVDVKTPIFASVDKGQVAKLNTKTINFGGVEDD